MLWGLLFGGLYIAAIISVLLTAKKLAKFGIIRKLAREKKKKAFIIGLLILFATTVLLVLTIKTINAVIALIHLLVFWAAFDLLGLIIKKIRGKDFERYYLGCAAILFTVTYLVCGAYMNRHVWEKDYTVETGKEVGSLKVAMIADSHIGTTFDGDGFAEHIKTIEAAGPDLLIISGDFVDDDSKKEDMVKTVNALGEMKTTYGVYYVPGNHDKGYMNYRGFSYGEMTSLMREKGIHVMEDDIELVDDRFYIIGRKDRSEERGSGRKSMAALIEGLDTSKYMIVADHQPHDYDAQEASGVDLVLSGHTHGGQVFPANILEVLAKADDKLYGLERRSNTDFVVTSGISDWAIIFKTCTRSEFVIVNVQGK